VLSRSEKLAESGAVASQAVGRSREPYRGGVKAGDAPGTQSVRTAEVIATLSLATDLGIGVPLEHGLQSTLVAARLSERLGVDDGTARDAYYLALLFYVGCTAGAELAAGVFGADDALTTFATPVRFGGRAEMARGMLRAVAPPGGSVLTRAAQLAHGLPRLAREFKGHVAASCEVAQMLSDRLGLSAGLGGLFAFIDERWDGKGARGGVSGDAIPLAVRIAQVARDAMFQCMVGGPELAARVVGGRAGAAFDPSVAGLLADDVDEIVASSPAPRPGTPRSAPSRRRRSSSRTRPSTRRSPRWVPSLTSPRPTSPAIPRG
jgi:hypothetical protein